MVVGGEGRVVFDYEVEIREVEAAGGDVCGEKERGGGAVAEGVGD